MEILDYDKFVTDKFNDIIDRVKKYNPGADIPLLTQAFETANNAHKGVKRKSGEPYIIHPLGVVEILCELEMDDYSICAGFLHDVVEDVPGWSIERIKTEFNSDIASRVDGLTKLSDKEINKLLKNQDDEIFDLDDESKYFAKNAANMRKIIIFMIQDFRVMVIKLADRVHNMRTLASLSQDRQKRMAWETIQIFAPIAHRLGVYKIKSELEDLSFKYLYPQEYHKMAELVNKTKKERKFILEMCVDQLQNVLKANNIEAEVQARAKTLWSIRNKMIKKKCAFEDIMDLLALRVIVKTQAECYMTLGVVHELWMPIPGMVTDYIAKPKPNGYKSLHTKVLALDGDAIEVQIRTEEMHSTAENGVAAHWKYKEGTTKGDFYDRKLAFLRQRFFDMEKNTDSSEQLFNSIINDMFAEQILTFTPMGDVIDLKAGSTPIDFAYRVHSDVGNHCVGAKVSGKMVSLSTELQNGDIVEIISSPTTEPSMDWLNFVKTDTAKQNIRRFFKLKYADTYEALGRELVDKEIIFQEKDRVKILTPENIKQLLGVDYKTEKDLFVAVGIGNYSAKAFVNRCQKIIDKKSQKVDMPISVASVKEAPVEVAFEGINNVLFTRAKCCDPLPGEEVLGYVTRGKGITIHAKDCSNVPDLLLKEPERLTNINWKPTKETFPARLKAKAKGKTGILNSITSIIAAEDVKLTGLSMKEDRDKFMDLEIIVNVRDFNQLNFIVGKIKDLSDILDIYRPVARETKK